MEQGTKKRIINAVSIAGVDPSGGAGLLADVKAMSTCGAYACGVVTALTAQNTQGVSGIMPVPPAFVEQQLETLFADVAIDSVKIGMLDNADLIEVVAQALEKYRPKFVVLDPVMVAKSGDRLLKEEAILALKERLLPLVTMVTPNLPEALAILGQPDRVVSEADFPAMAADLWKLMKRRDGWVYLKGGHLGGPESPDMLFNGYVTVRLEGERIKTSHDHGTGCTLSSALAALLPRHDVIEACRQAKRYLTGALRYADELEVGHGHGPTHHFWQMSHPKDEGNIGNL